MDIGRRLMRDIQARTGLPFHAVAGIAGNGHVESAGYGTLQEIKPVVPGSRGGYGYFQWTGPRRRAFERFAKEKGLDVSGYDANLEFLLHELTNTPEKSVVPLLMKSKDAEDAAEIFSNKFLRPGTPHLDRRRRHAREYGAQPLSSVEPTPSRPQIALAALEEAPAPQASQSPLFLLDPRDFMHLNGMSKLGSL